jgi:hypothetical protein
MLLSLLETTHPIKWGEQQEMVQRIIRSGHTRFLIPVFLAAHLMACGGGGGGGGGSNSAGTSNVSTEAVTLAWDPPVARADESPLLPSEIGGYRIYYGTQEGDYPNRIDFDDGTAESVKLIDLAPGTYYFVITTYDTDGRESEYSSVITATL